MERNDTAVEHHIRRLGGEALAALVADLWAVRGYETTREGGVVTARHGSETVRIEVPAAGRTTGDGPADVVVAVDGRPREDVCVVDAADLRERLTYAVDGAVARDLCERHLGAPPSDLRPPPLVRVRRRAERLSERSALAAIALVLLLGVGVVGAGALVFPPGASAGASDEAVPAGTPTPVVGSTGPAAVSAAPPPGTPGSDDPQFPSGVDVPLPFPSSADTLPPGVRGGSLVDPTALATAHERAMANRSHTVWLDRYRPRGSDPNRTRIQRDIDVATDGERYLITTEEETESGGAELLGSVYFNGAIPYGAVWDEANASYGRVFSIDPRRELASSPDRIRETVVERYLTTPTANVTGRTDWDGKTAYRIVGHGQPDGNAFGTVRNYTVVAVVDARGFVRDLTAEYTRRSGGRTYRVRHEVTYGRIGTTAVEPPTWYERREGVSGEGI
jgi:hypothetical protein